MTNQQNHPITPPPELVEKWISCAYTVTERGAEILAEVATQAANWGADQELEACCEWLAQETPEPYISALRAARCPKPPSLKEQALAAFEHILNQSSTELGADTIRRALEQLPND